jgi:hypothetical protein
LDEFDEVDVAWLSISYLRRMQLEARIYAAAVVNAWGEASGDGRSQRIPPEAMIFQMGGFS